MHIENEVHGYWFNRAVARFGMSLDAELKEAGRKSKTDSEAQRKAKMVLNRWLREPEEQEQGPKKFRDPAIRR